jgi:hypothetical protein
MAIDIDTVAKHEIALSKKSLRYDERQKMKRGEYEAVAASLLRRAKIRVIVMASIAAYMLGLAAFTKIEASWFILLLTVLSYFDYSHAKRTAETIRTLTAETSPNPAPEAG